LVEALPNHPHAALRHGIDSARLYERVVPQSRPLVCDTIFERRDDDFGGDVVKIRILELYQRQVEIKREADGIVGEIVENEISSNREFYRDLDEGVAVEILRGVLLRWGVRAMREQILRFLEAILTYENGKKFNLPGGVMVRMGRESFDLDGETGAEVVELGG